MARPNPKVLLRHQDNESRFEVCEAQAIWAVFYKENPINLRSKTYTNKNFKYIKCTYSNKAHAFRLAEKLNRMFNCNDFNVKEFI